MILNFLIYLTLNFFSLLLMLIFMLISVAYLTLLERKILSYIQYRKGPNKVGFVGIFQPFSDAIKLIFKEMLIIFKSNYMIFYLSPIMMMFFMMMNWLLLPWLTNLYSMNYSLILLFVYMSLGGFMMLMTGWSSNSMFSLIGAIRLVAQSVSYEVSFMLIIYCFMIFSESYSLMDLSNWQLYMWNLIIFFPLFLIFFISMLAELNRSPMDLVEGESELVSGFNIEYFSGGFTLIFLSEYGMIIFFCLLVLILFTNMYYSNLFFILGVYMMLLLIIYMRGILPRIRYDELMYLCWKIILPLVLNYLIFIFGVKFMILISI